MKLRALALASLGACVSTPDRPCSPPRELTELTEAGLSPPFFSPTLSRDRRNLFFGSPNGCGARNGLWRAHRDDPVGTFSSPMCLIPSDATNDNFDPTLSSDGSTLWYVYGDGNSGGVIIQVQLAGTNGDGNVTSTQPVFVPQFMKVLHPTFTDDLMHMYFVVTDGNGNHGLATASRGSAMEPQFDTMQPLDALNLTGTEAGTTILPDGSKLYFESRQFGNDNADHIGYATRAGQFADPKELASPHHVVGYGDDLGSIHPDDQTIVFESYRSTRDPMRPTLWLACE